MEKIRSNAGGFDIGAKKVFISIEVQPVVSHFTFTEDFYTNLYKEWMKVKKWISSPFYLICSFILYLMLDAGYWILDA